MSEIRTVKDGRLTLMVRAMEIWARIKSLKFERDRLKSQPREAWNRRMK